MWRKFKQISEGKQYVLAQKKKMLLTAILEAINNGFDLLCALMFVVTGIFFVQSGIATLGEVAGIYTMHTMLSSRFLQLGKNYPELMNCFAYATKIFEFLDKEEDVLWEKTA
jgi:ATP-binding cassette subfamily B protein